MKLSAIVDSSPLINLVHLELADKLDLYFERIYVPRMVQREVNRKSRFRYRLNKLYSKGAFQKCVVVEAMSVKFLDELDEGEAEALVQASENGIPVFIGDDRDARTISEARGIRPVGTIRLLARMHLEGYADETVELVKKLRRDLKCRIADDVVEDAVRSASLPF